jgi:DNA ligase-1
MTMLLAEIVETSAAVSGTAARSEKIERLATTLRRVEPGEASIAVAYLSSQLRQRQIGVGYASMRDLPEPAQAPTLTLRQVDTALESIGAATGKDSQTQRRRLLQALLAQATSEEQHFLMRLIIGELRQGALEGVMHEALARALNVQVADVRRAAMLRGDLHAVAEAALRDGPAGLNEFRLRVGQPVQPMLAQSATSVAAALERTKSAAIDWKLDGARVQIHRQGADVSVFTRSLDDITSRVPELVEMAQALPVSSVVLDGETLSLQSDGRPHPFQVSASRFGSKLDVERLRAALPLTPFVFDILHLDGADLIDHSLDERLAVLRGAVAERWRVPQLLTDDVDAAAAFAADTLARGHEGVVVKALDSLYEAGRRGTGWIKVKPSIDIDLVILAAEWGHGRRNGWLSNLHLGARDPDTGGYVMLGKTFKGLTDEMLRWQTQRLLELETHRDRWTVYVRPELVAEIRFDGVQRSSRYPGGIALRFARVVRYREDKTANEADTIETVRLLGGREPGQKR